MNVTYNPNGITLGDSIYSYCDDYEKTHSDTRKQLMPTNGMISQMIDLKIKRSADTLVAIERDTFFVKTDGYLYFYFDKYVDKITTDLSCVHITNLPADSCFLRKGEYFYNHFTDLFAEYVVRFDDGDVMEYRKFSDWCPNYLYTERYNAFKQKTHYELQLPNKMFYSVSYHQPGGSIHQEKYCSADGTLCNETTYIYDKKGELRRKEITQTEPCIVVVIDGKKRSTTLGFNEDLLKNKGLIKSNR
jgi:hypothetical protein